MPNIARAWLPFLRVCGSTEAVGPVEFTVPSVAPTDVTRPRDEPVAGCRPLGNGLFKVPTKVRPLSADAWKGVLGVKPVCTSDAVMPDSWKGAVKIPNPPRITVLSLRA